MLDDEKNKLKKETPRSSKCSLKSFARLGEEAKTAAAEAAGEYYVREANVRACSQRGSAAASWRGVQTPGNALQLQPLRLQLTRKKIVSERE